MQSRTGDEGFGVGTLQELQDPLHHHRGNPAAAGGSEQSQRVGVVYGSRRHRRQHAFSGRDSVGLAADQAVQVRVAGLGGEIVHLVVQQDSGAGRSEPGAKQAVDGQGGANPVAVPIQDAEVRGVPGFRFGRVEALRRSGTLGIEIRHQFPGVLRAGQLLDRNVYVVGVAQVFGALQVGPAQSFDQAMNADVVPVFVEPVLAQHVEDLR